MQEKQRRPINLCICIVWSGHSLFVDMFNSIYTDCIWAAPCENVSLGTCIKERPWSACTSRQSDQGLLCLPTESLDSIKYTNGDQMPVWNFAYAQEESESVHFGHVGRHIFSWHGPTPKGVCFCSCISYSLLPADMTNWQIDICNQSRPEPSYSKLKMLLVNLSLKV